MLQYKTSCVLLTVHSRPGYSITSIVSDFRLPCCTSTQKLCVGALLQKLETVLIAWPNKHFLKMAGP